MKTLRHLFLTLICLWILAAAPVYANTYAGSTAGSWTVGELSDSNTEDYYTITLPGDGWLTYKLQGKTIQTAAIKVMDMDETTTYSSSTIQRSSEASPVTTEGTCALTAGSYKVKVNRYKAYSSGLEATNGTYRILCTFQPAQNDEQEPNDIFDTAMYLPESKKVTGFLALNDTLDYYKFELKTTQKVRITCTAMLYTWLKIWNGDLEVIKTVEGKYGTSESSPKVLTYEAELPAGTYYMCPSTGTNYNRDYGRYILSWEYAQCVHVWEVKNVTKKATCAEEGKQEVVCAVCGKTETQTIPATNDHSFQKIIKPATVSAKGSITSKCKVCGTVQSVTSIPKIKSAVLSCYTYTYNGTARKPSVTVKNANGGRISSSNYTVTYASGRKNVGTYRVTIRFKNQYKGTLTRSFKINPKGTTISKLTSKSKGFQVKLRKQALQTSGYQVQYTMGNKRFTSTSKIKSLSPSTLTTLNCSLLKGGKTYYVRVRTYKLVGGKLYYSAWSAAKKVITKK